jgi:hypothetical protein
MPLIRRVIEPSIDELISAHCTLPGWTVWPGKVRMFEGMDDPGDLRRGHSIIVEAAQGPAIAATVFCRQTDSWELFRSPTGDNGDFIFVGRWGERPGVALWHNIISYAVTGCLVTHADTTTTVQLGDRECLGLWHAQASTIVVLGGTAARVSHALSISVFARGLLAARRSLDCQFSHGAVAWRGPTDASQPGTIGHLVIGLRDGRVLMWTVGPADSITCRVVVTMPGLTALDFDRQSPVLYVADAVGLWRVSLAPRRGRKVALVSKSPGLRHVIGLAGQVWAVGGGRIVGQSSHILPDTAVDEDIVTAGSYGGHPYVVISIQHALQIICLD